jgi:SP family facilitated glucose transporter-like MFS transporter 8
MPTIFVIQTLEYVILRPRKYSSMSLIVYIIGFSLGWGPIPLLVMSELFPAKARGAASGLATLVNWFCAFLVTKEFSLMQDWFGEAATFWIFGALILT